MSNRSFSWRAAAATLLIVGVSAGLPVRAAKAQGGGVTHVDTVPAPSLRNNLVGDPDQRAMTIYLPPSYAKERHRRYPVIYLLHGFAADHRAFMKGAYQNLNIRISMDSLIHAGLVKEMIVVTPNARDFFDGSFYANSPVTGNWENFIVHDLVSYVDKHYRTIPRRSARGIAGHSMGGYGAFNVGMRNTKTFSAIYMLSACCLTSGPNVGGANPKAWKAVLTAKQREDVPRVGFVPDILLALAAVYSPDLTDPPLYVRFPYAVQDDSLVVVPQIEAKWEASPLNMARSHAADLKRVAIGFDAGIEDSFRDIPANVTILDTMLTSLGIPHSAELYHGNHGNHFRERLESKALPFFSKNLH